MKNIVVFLPRSKFPVKLICCIAFGLHQVVVVYLIVYLKPDFSSANNFVSAIEDVVFWAAIALGDISHSL